jgi:hypothetical protein
VAADYSIKSSKTALVVKPGAKITRVTGPYGALYLGDPNSGSVYMDFMWIEGAVSAPTTTAINGNLHRFSMFRHVNIVGPGVTGVSVPCAKSKFVDFASTQVSNIAMSLSGRECTVHGATIDGSSYGIFIADYNSAFATGPNTVENVTISNGAFSGAGQAAIVISSNASGTILTNATITNPYSAGIRVNGNNSLLTGITITDTSGNMSDGVNVSSSASGNTLEDITVRGGLGIGIALAGTGHRVNNADVSSMNLQGIEIRGSGHRVSNVIVANVVGSGAGAGVRLIDTSRNRVWNVMVGNTGDPPYGGYGRGVQITFAVAPQDARSDNIISNVFLVNNGIMGFDLNGAQSSLFQYMTIANTGHENSLDTTPNPVSFGGRGIRFNSGFIKGNTFNNMLIANNPDSGLDVNPHVTGTSSDWVTGTTFNDMAIVGNGKRSYGSVFGKDIGTGIRLGEYAVDVVFHGALILADNGVNPNQNCHVFADATVKTEAGLTNSNPDYSCTPVGSSDATLDIAIDGYGAVGAVTGDDTANQSDTNGLAAVGSVAADDWTRFAGIERMWGRAGSAFPNPDNWGMCRSPGTCQIYDWSLSASDNNFRGILPVPTGGDYLVHTFFAADATKCAAVPAFWTGSLCQSTYLVNAVEVMDDTILANNGNLLCESGETCIYMPNIGAYQGHGPLISAGAFTDGVVTGVTLLKYTTNGR